MIGRPKHSNTPFLARLEQAITEYLGEPLEDPHGHLIPTRERGKLTGRMLRPLPSFRPGECAVIREVQDDRPERLRRQVQNSVCVRAARVTLMGHEPLDGTFQIQVDGLPCSSGCGSPDWLAGGSRLRFRRRMASFPQRKSQVESLGPSSRGGSAFRSSSCSVWGFLTPS